jgi:hypothetical protein
VALNADLAQHLLPLQPGGGPKGARTSDLYDANLALAMVPMSDRLALAHVIEGIFAALKWHS